MAEQTKPTTEQTKPTTEQTKPTNLQAQKKKKWTKQTQQISQAQPTQQK